MLPTTSSLLHPKVVERVEDQIKQKKQKAKYYHDHTAKLLPEIEVGSLLNWESLKSAIKAIGDEIDSPSINLFSVEQKEDLKYDYKQAQEMVFQWKAHIIRAETQERGKQNVLNSLQSNSALVIMDWATKFLQLKYREKQYKWFAKRGLNWLVSCVITRNAADNGLEIVPYVHLFDSCAQHWYTVCAILGHLLSTVKENKPKVTQVFL